MFFQPTWKKVTGVRLVLPPAGLDVGRFGSIILIFRIGGQLGWT